MGGSCPAAFIPAYLNLTGKAAVMQRSIDRILTTHTGSLPRPPAMLGLLVEEQQSRLPDRADLDTAVRDAVHEVAARQAAVGLDVINDGEQGRVDYTVYVKDRLTGFDGESAPLAVGDPEFPELAELLKPFASPFQLRPACTGPIAWADWPAVEQDIANLKAATAATPAAEVFMTAPSRRSRLPVSCLTNTTPARRNTCTPWPK